MEHARRAAVADVASIAELARSARTELAPQRGGAVALAELRWVRGDPAEVEASSNRSDELVVVGCLEDAVVGYAHCVLTDLHDGSRIVRIDEIYVMPAARGVGVGEAVLELVLGWAAEQNCDGVDALALPGMRHTKNFFETFGLVARAITVHRSLHPVPAPDGSEAP